MAEKSVCSINCLGCHLGMTWRGLMGQEPKRSTENEPLSKPSGSTPDSCITPACLKSWLCVGGCHTKKLAWFYGLVLILALLCIAAVPALVFLRGAGPGRICGSDYWDLTIEECWMKLVDVDAPLHWTDILSLTGSALAAVSAALGICAAIANCKKLLYLVTALLFLGCLGQFAASGGQGILLDADIKSLMTDQMRNDLRNDMIMSLTQYEYDPVIKSAWDNYNRQHCCCGVESYQDWYNMVPDMGVPETCVCTKRSSNYEYNQPFKCPVNPSRYDDYGSNCDAIQDPLSELNITSKGCLSEMYRDMAYNVRGVMQPGFVVLLALAGSQMFFGIIIPLVGLCSCCRKASHKVKITPPSGVHEVYSPTMRSNDQDLLSGGTEESEEVIDDNDENPII